MKPRQDFILRVVSLLLKSPQGGLGSTSDPPILCGCEYGLGVHGGGNFTPL